MIFFKEKYEIEFLSSIFMVLHYVEHFIFFENFKSLTLLVPKKCHPKTYIFAALKFENF